jgi:hypothetical protein
LLRADETDEEAAASEYQRRAEKEAVAAGGKARSRGIPDMDVGPRCGYGSLLAREGVTHRPPCAEPVWQRAI